MAELIIHDGTPERDLYVTGFGTGLDLSRRASAGGFAYGGLARPFPSELRIPRTEWQARIAEMEATKTRLSDLCDQAGLPPKNQAMTNYCWGNSPTYCLEAVRAAQNEPTVILSAASICGPATGYRNARPWPGQAAGVGGFGPDALAWIVSHGVVPESLWPANAIDSKYATPEALEAARAYSVTSWFECEPNDLDAVVSLLLRRVPVSAGLSWWGHQVSYIDPVWKDGAIAIRFRNSWGPGYGDRGYGILQGGRIYASDAVAPTIVLAA